MAEILPFESADMWYEDAGLIIPRWSLAALLRVLPLFEFITPLLIGTPNISYRCVYNDDLKSHAYDNPIDACYDMILKLNELKIL